jgi:hypothetical protein
VITVRLFGVPWLQFWLHLYPLIPDICPNSSADWEAPVYCSHRRRRPPPQAVRQQASAHDRPPASDHPTLFRAGRAGVGFSLVVPDSIDSDSI